MIESILREYVGCDVRTKIVDTVGGGCISRAFRVETTIGRWFVKLNDADFADNFAAEADGLAALAAKDVDGLIVPDVIAYGVHLDDRTSKSSAFLVLPWIDARPASDSFEHRFGRTLANFHRANRSRRFGWSRDNYLGASKQINTATGKSGGWIEFVAECRFEPQLRWAAERGLADDDLVRDVTQVVRRLGNLMDGSGDRFTLLHGDLWSGNIIDAGGSIAMIDPAVWRGVAEADLAMLRLFGGVGSTFWKSYQEIYPLDSRWSVRTDVFVLYHLLNHLNLFGRAYLDRCRRAAKDLIAAA